MQHKGYVMYFLLNAAPPSPKPLDVTSNFAAAYWSHDVDGTEQHFV